MLSINDFIILFLFGSFGGFMSGYLGVGGGIIYVPVLDYFLSKYFHDTELVKAVLANSLFVIMFSAAVASYKQYKLGNLFFKEIIQTLLPGIVSVVILQTLINKGTWYSRDVFLYFFLTMLLFVVFKMFLSKPKAIIAESTKADNYKYNITGAFAGIVTAMSGLGGGVIMTPVFTEWMKLDIKKASAISTGVILGFAVVIGILNLNAVPKNYVSNFQFGYVLLPIALPLIIGTFLFAQMGVKTAQKSKSQTIRIIFATFASIVLLKVIYEILIIHSII
ncbi:MAG: sulfite exporter TauE/SafE family protein [Bacteroidia bacterium]|nr:sulfite exporter TauE/SafE family protein [Bacteroidia bacterium]